jgi:hypothetical protein
MLTALVFPFALVVAPSLSSTLAPSFKDLRYLNYVSTTNIVAMDLRAQLNQRESPLLRLPAEIRICIYEFIFEGEIVQLCCPKAKQNQCWYCTPTYPYLSPLSLLVVCRQVYVEALPIAYKICIFDLGSFGPSALDPTKESCKLMQQIRVKPCMSNSMTERLVIDDKAKTCNKFAALRRVGLRPYTTVPIHFSSWTELLRSLFDQPHLEVDLLPYR